MIQENDHEIFYHTRFNDDEIRGAKNRRLVAVNQLRKRVSNQLFCLNFANQS